MHICIVYTCYVHTWIMIQKGIFMFEIVYVMKIITMIIKYQKLEQLVNFFLEKRKRKKNTHTRHSWYGQHLKKKLIQNFKKIKETKRKTIKKVTHHLVRSCPSHIPCGWCVRERKPHSLYPLYFILLVYRGGGGGTLMRIFPNCENNPEV